MKRPETKIEEHFTKRVEAVGGISIKTVPAQLGMPDRLAAVKGRLYLVELKAPRGVLRPGQRIFHERMRRIGVAVAVLSNKAEVDRWVSDLTGS